MDVGCKWTFKINREVDGNVSRYKARLVAQVFLQKYGHDYNKVFGPVAVTLRILLSIAGALSNNSFLKLSQM